MGTGEGGWGGERTSQRGTSWWQSSTYPLLCISHYVQVRHAWLHYQDVCSFLHIPLLGGEGGYMGVWSHIWEGRGTGTDMYNSS